MKWNRRATLVDLGGLHCYKLFTCEYHRRPPSSSSSLTIISWFSIIFQTDVMMWTTLHEDRRSYSSQSPAPGVWGRTATSPSVLRDTKSTNTGEELLWASFLPCKTRQFLCGCRIHSQSMEKQLKRKSPAWSRVWCYHPSANAVLGWRIPSFSQPELHLPLQTKNIPAWPSLEQALFAVHAEYFLFNLFILQS